MKTLPCKSVARPRRVLVASIVALLAASGFARADLSWDAVLNNGLIDGGAGFWNPTFPNWTVTGASNVPWDSTGAIFGGAAGLVSINSSVSATGLTFNTPGYVIVGDPFDGITTDDTLTLTGGAGIVVNANATIRTIIAGSAGLNLSGTATLTLTNAANSFTGGINIDGATLAITGNGTADQPVLGSGAKTVTLTNGGTLRITSGNFDPNASTKSLAVAAGGTNVGNFQQDSGTATFDASGQLSVASGATLNKIGAGTLVLASTQAGFLGGLSVSGGAVRLTSITALPAVATITLNSGGSLVLSVGDATSTPGTPVLGSSVAYANGFANPLTLAGGTLMTAGGVGQTRALTGPVTLQTGTTTKLVPTDAITNGTLRNFVRFTGKVTGSGNLRVEAPTHGYPGNSGNNNNRPGIILNNTANDLSGVISIGDNIGVTSQATVDGSGIFVNSGNCFGSAKLLVAGTLVADSAPFGALPTLVISDALATAGVSNASVVYGNAIEFQSDGRINVQRQGSVSLNNKISFGALTVTGNRTLQLFSEGGRYTTGFGGGGATSTLAGNATIQTFEADGTFSTGNVAFDGPIVETGGPRSLTIVSNFSNDSAFSGITTGTVTLNDAASYTGLTDLRGGGLTLAGANGKLTATSGLSVRNNTLFLYNNPNSTGIVSTTASLAASSVFTIDNSITNVANRLADSIPVALTNSTLSLKSNIAAATNANEAIGTVTLLGGSTLDATLGNAGAISALTLGGIARPGSGTAVFTGTGGTLGAAGNSPRIILSGQATTGFVGAWATTPVAGNGEWLKYDATVNSGFALGFVPFGAGDYTNDPAAFASGVHAKLTGSATTTLAGAQSAATLNFQGTATRTVDTNGNLLTLENGGILVNAVNAALNGSALGGITAGITSALSELIITDNGTTTDTFTLGAAIVDNGAGGAVKLVKAGGGRTILPGTNANTYSGGTVINAGFLEAQSTITSGAIPTGLLSTGAVTLAGGQLNLRVNVASGSTGTFTNDLIVNGDALVSVDRFSGTNTAGDIAMNSLTIGNQTLQVLGANSYAFAINNGVTLTGNASINNSSANVRLYGAITDGGSGYSLWKNGTSNLNIGSGSGDVAANTFTGGLRLAGGITLLNKAANTIAAPGPITLVSDASGGTLATALNLGANEQIADTAAVTLNGGTFNIKTIAGLGVTETMGNLTVNGGGIAGFLRTATTGTVQANVASARLSISDLALSHQGSIAVINLFTGTSGTEGVLTLRGNLNYAGASGNNGIDANPTILGTTGAPTAGQTRGTLSLPAGDHIFTVVDIAGISEEVRVDALVAGAGRLIKAGPGRVGLNVTVNENNAFTGGVRVDAGELHARASGTGTGNPLGTGTTTLNGGKLFLAFSGAGSSGTIANVATVPLAVTADSAIDVNNNGANTGNRIQVASLGIGANKLSVVGGGSYVFEVAGTTTTTGAAVIGSDSTASTPSTVRLNAIAGSGSLSKTGVQSLAFAGEINATGGVSVDEGPATMLATGSLSGMLSVAHIASLDVTAFGGGFNIPSGATLAANGTITGSLNVLNGGELDGSGLVTAAVVVANGGTLAVAKNQGALPLPKDFRTGTGLSLAGTGGGGAGALRFEGTGAATITPASGTTLTADSSIGVTTSGASLTLNNAIGGAFNLTKVGAGTLVLPSATTFSGTTTVANGTLNAAINGALASTTAVTVNTGGTLLLSGAATNNRINDAAAIILAGTLNTGGLDEGPVGGVSGAGAAMGALTLSANSTIDFFTGATASGSNLLFASLNYTPGDAVSILNWTGMIASDDGSAGNDRVLFSSAPGFTDSQLASISFFNDAGSLIGTGATVISFNGYSEIVPVPEPSAALTGLLLLGLAGWREGRSKVARTSVRS